MLTFNPQPWKVEVEWEGWGVATRAFNKRQRAGRGANSCSREVT
jgi:hypothetical protein